MVPSNVVKTMAEFDMFGVIFFSIMFGIFMMTCDEKKRAPMVGFIESGCEIMMRMTAFVISLAPIGIAALVGFTVATSGPEIFLSLIGYVVTVALALAIHVFVSIPVLVWVLTRRNPFVYMRAMSPALLTAFSTASSAGTLALTMDEARRGAGISNRITSFVLPLGATVNMDGTALYECVTVLFIAQVHAATHPEFAPLTFGAQLMVVFLALAVSVGAAGIPHAGLVMMVIILNAVNLPLEYTALVWAVDRLLDMARTMTNVWSDSCGALVIGHTEHEVDDAVLFHPAKAT
jgi:Na+/H+-dicarboxylate symporter